MDSVLPIWAVIGPILTASFTQWWNQRVKREDRKFSSDQKNHEIKQLEKSEINKNRRIQIKEKHDRNQEAYINFLSYSHRLFSMCLYSSLDVSDVVQNELYNSFIQAHQKVMLIGDAKIAAQASLSFNATEMAIRKSQDYEGTVRKMLHETYRLEMGKFQISARLHLNEITENSESDRCSDSLNLAS